MAESYEREKLANAVSALVSAAPIQKRLEYAFMAMHTLKRHAFVDPERQLEYEAIYEALTADKSDGGDGYVANTCSKLTDEESEKIADQIVSLNTALNWNRVYELEDEIARLKKSGRS